jgi:hypothetical protein
MRSALLALPSVCCARRISDEFINRRQGLFVSKNSARYVALGEAGHPTLAAMSLLPLPNNSLCDVKRVHNLMNVST